MRALAEVTLELNNTKLSERLQSLLNREIVIMDKDQPSIVDDKSVFNYKTQELPLHHNVLA